MSILVIWWKFWLTLQLELFLFFLLTLKLIFLNFTTVCMQLTRLRVSGSVRPMHQFLNPLHSFLCTYKLQLATGAIGCAKANEREVILASEGDWSGRSWWATRLLDVIAFNLRHNSRLAAAVAHRPIDRRTETLGAPSVWILGITAEALDYVEFYTGNEKWSANDTVVDELRR